MVSLRSDRLFSQPAPDIVFEEIRDVVSVFEDQTTNVIDISASCRFCFNSPPFKFTYHLARHIHDHIISYAKYCQDTGRTMSGCTMSGFEPDHDFFNFIRKQTIVRGFMS